MNMLFANAVRHALSKYGFFEMLFDEDKAPMALTVIVASVVMYAIISIIREGKK